MVEASLQQYTIDEVATHNSAESTWIIMEGKIYDVTKFLMEHPGGEEVILEQAGKDATESFNDVGHSSDAKELANDYLVGILSGSSTLPKSDAKASDNSAEKSNTGNTWSNIIFSSTWTNFLIPVAISIGVYVAYKLAELVINNL